MASPDLAGDKMACLVGKTYVDQGLQSVRAVSASFSELMEKRKIPEKGFTDQQIEFLLNQLSLMDSNNFPGNSGVGEREGRCLSGMVGRRNFYLTHGIGRSGDVSEVQPKAAGSSLVLKLATSMALHAIQICGVKKASECLLLPLATGMALTFCMLALRGDRPLAKYVIFLRVDQKSCFKSINTAGYQPIVINGKLVGDEIQTDIDALKVKLEEIGSDNILCVMSNTSCFAPRVPDDLVQIGNLCQKVGVPHIVNNAYGLQSSKCCHLLSETIRTGGRIDAFVQSMDKNFGTPVGGSIVAGFGSTLTEKISKCYPGRASVGPILDLMITFLSLGTSGIIKLLHSRKQLFDVLRNSLSEAAGKYGERVLSTRHNDISMGVTLGGVDKDQVTEIGSMLFKRFVSGARVVPTDNRKVINGTEFRGYGAHMDDYPVSYLTAAAAVGVTQEDITLFIKRLEKDLKVPKLKKFQVLSKKVVAMEPVESESVSASGEPKELDALRDMTISNK